MYFQRSAILDEDGQEWPVIGPFWTIPAERMKEGKEHRVPLSARAVEILKKQKREATMPGDFVFIGRKNKSLGKNTFFKLLDVMKRDVTTHGFRTSFRTWAGNETDFPVDVCEVAIAHSVGEKMATYSIDCVCVDIATYMTYAALIAKRVN
jgi:integrase